MQIHLELGWFKKGEYYTFLRTPEPFFPRPGGPRLNEQSFHTIGEEVENTVNSENDGSATRQVGGFEFSAVT